MTAIRAAALSIVLVLLLIAGYEWMGRKTPAPAPALPSAPATPTLATPLTPTPVVDLRVPHAVPKPLLTSATAKPKKRTPSPTPKKPDAAPSVPVRPTSLPYVPAVVLPPAEPPPPTEWKGSDTAIEHPGQIVVKNDDQWIRFWAEHHPHEASPDVDFSKYTVVGVFAGPRPADAFTIAIQNVQSASDGVTVLYQEHAPPPGTFAIGVTIYPYDIKAIPRTTLPVKFKALQPADGSR